jgi:SpoVK/Ycf46/Vps4 family AAA+-type ATPase
MLANAVLFFDEADALFGKRTEVKDAHDRYANLEVSYLLQRIEDHEGLVILATNLNGSLDEAFARRLRHIVVFPLPDKGLRMRLWRQAFPAQAPLDPKLDLELIARIFELSGGNIRNAALAAAFFAAADDRPIGPRHVVRAIARELEKLGRPPNAADFGELRDFVDADARLAP